ncbi:MAG TPA: hypothetical protein PLX25_00385 [Sphaerochaeta sp.]|nr:hypothetical protein [Sphaerochaeta sp.]
MKRTHIGLIIILTVVSMGLGAHPTAETQYAAIAGKTFSLSEAKPVFEKLDVTIEKEREALGKTMAEAVRKGDLQAYRQGQRDLALLSTYRMSRKQSDALLSELLTLDESEQGEWAAWLQEKSPYWRPTLTLDFSSEGEGYRYSYRQQIRANANGEVTLPAAGDIRFNTRQVGILAGWGLTPDSVTYQQGETITMPYTDQTLYAIYQDGVRFIDERSNIDLVFSGEEITVPVPESGSAEAIFGGWYDRTTGELITDVSSYQREGKGGYYEALWKEVSIDGIALLYWDSSAVPTNTQLAVGFSYTNRGNVDERALRATLSSESEYVTLLRDQLTLSRLNAGYTSTNNSRWSSTASQRIYGEANTMRLLISPDAPSGTEIPLTLTITDEGDNQWSREFVLTVR